MTTNPEGSTSKIELVEEIASVTLEQVTTGRVRVATRTETFSEDVTASLETSEAHVTRVPINRYLDPDAPLPETRTQGSLTIVPVLEEVMVVETRILLKEEVHIELLTRVQDVTLPVSVRRQRADIERTDETG